MGLVASGPTSTRSGWFVVGGTSDPSLSGQYVQAFVLCAPTGQAVAAGVNAAKAKDQAAVKTIIDQFTAQQEAADRRCRVRLRSYARAPERSASRRLFATGART